MLAAMSQTQLSLGCPLILEPTGVYDDGALVLGLGLTHAALIRARRDRRLRFTRKGQRTLYLGSWVLDWLNDEPTPGEDENTPGQEPAARRVGARS